MSLIFSFFVLPLNSCRNNELAQNPNFFRIPSRRYKVLAHSLELLRYLLLFVTSTKLAQRHLLLPPSFLLLSSVYHVACDPSPTTNQPPPAAKHQPFFSTLLSSSHSLHQNQPVLSIYPLPPPHSTSPQKATASFQKCSSNRKPTSALLLSVSAPQCLPPRELGLRKCSR
ncbi:hypothetical protein LI328DRAFT_112371 [Trichoderma asperelloides]|nr:hypothetical protein LI328DRAFT_112371 [Trichoderma asperelloides]